MGIEGVLSEDKNIFSRLSLRRLFQKWFFSCWYLKIFREYPQEFLETPKSIQRIFGEYPENKSVRRIFVKKRKTFWISRHLACCETRMHTRGTWMSRATWSISFIEHERKTFANLRRSRFLNRTIKERIWRRLRQRHVDAPVLSLEEVSDFGIVLLPIDSYGSSYGISVDHWNRLADSESYIASLDLPRRQLDVTSGRLDLAEIGYRHLYASTDCVFMISLAIILERLSATIH